MDARTQIASGTASTGSSRGLDTFSCNGMARLANITAAAARVVLRRLMRARQSHNATDAATRAMPQRVPPTIAAIFFPLLLWLFVLEDRNCA